ncbi:glutamate--cysteine ligase regulatory subunit isoform X2 [Eurytemora carolleeae]|uniref:glutamate--cysteine ligase regulatory subunit isoform X2 n=1 Tax=Eurytemora carolleeae TaxID=1294199 RepID=UPI000C77ABEF|nr:glutamate--cysteine ligase regulatory subunit isoform X2 [Eurytemora carolleeae]|eukprot:XP_023319565.1 glutamate--cysteine ligase regulatory subunit-like isoform X2 [Eurytemora affinis]
MNSLYLVGGNLVANAELRKRLGGRDPGVEIQMVVEDIFAGWKKDEAEVETEEKIVKNDDYIQEKFERNQLKITLKVFLHDFNVDNLKKAVNAALEQLKTDHVDNLFIAVPTDAVHVIGIGSGTGTGLVHTEALSSLQNVWSVVEEMIGAGRVGGAGLCDLRPSAFISLYNQATVKPTSIQVNLKSCCVVPEELTEFAKLNKVTLLTHSDPEELLPEDSLRILLYPHLQREAGHFSANWISRYLVQVKVNITCNYAYF